MKMIRSKINFFTTEMEPIKEIYAENVPRVDDHVNIDGESRKVKTVEWERLKPPQVQVRVE